MIAGYKPTPECFIIEQEHNKHHCYVPPEVWEIPAETVCQVCRVKNHRLFVQAAMQSNLPVEQPLHNIIQFEKPNRKLEDEITTQQPCQSCGRGKIFVKFWRTGVRICCECRAKEQARLSKLENATKIRSCRICGKTNLKAHSWRKAQNICRSIECFEKLMQQVAI